MVALTKSDEPTAVGKTSEKARKRAQEVGENIAEGIRKFDEIKGMNAEDIKKTIACMQCENMLGLTEFGRSMLQKLIFYRLMDTKLIQIQHHVKQSAELQRSVNLFSVRRQL